MVAPQPGIATVERSTEELFRGLLDAAPDAIVIVDRNGCITLINHQAEAYFGYPRDELVGQSIDVLVSERFRSGHAGYRTDYVASPRTRPMGEGRELYGRRKDGAEFPVEINLSLMRLDDDTLVIANVRDISARRRIEQDLR